MKNSKNVMDLDLHMTIATIGNMSYQWLNPMTTDNIRISGFCWIEKDKLYRRMPVYKSDELPLAVDQLANCCSGGQLCFQTDSTRIAIDAKFANSHTMYHMPPTGQLGFDCYVGECKKMQYAAIAKFDTKTKEYTVPLFQDIEKRVRTLTINFPLYNDSLESLKIGIEPAYNLCKIPSICNKCTRIFHCKTSFKRYGQVGY
jgi:hypothetical protein